MIKYSFNLLEKKDKTKLVIFTIMQSALSLLDIAGVTIFGLIGILTISGIQSLPAGARTTEVVKKFGLYKVRVLSVDGIPENSIALREDEFERICLK